MHKRIIEMAAVALAASVSGTAAQSNHVEITGEFAIPDAPEWVHDAVFCQIYLRLQRRRDRRPRFYSQTFEDEYEHEEEHDQDEEEKGHEEEITNLPKNGVGRPSRRGGVNEEF